MQYIALLKPYFASTVLPPVWGTPPQSWSICCYVLPPVWGTTGVPPQPSKSHGLHHHVLHALQCGSACATHCSWRQP